MLKAFQSRTYPKYATIEKILGETPLQAAERLRKRLRIDEDIPFAYAGRLDPMASGKLLILIGDECKRQIKYHNLDKTYRVEVMLGVASDSGDVLGLLELGPQKIITEDGVKKVFNEIPKEIILPYPHFSSKTVNGKPLHTWTLEGRLHEIEVPLKTSRIHTITFNSIRTAPKDEIVYVAQTKIESIPEVTAESKKLGADFRRQDVRASWRNFEQNGHQVYQILSFECTASSGTYMRSLAEYIAKQLETTGLAYSIHRAKIGKYIPITRKCGFWLRRY